MKNKIIQNCFRNVPFMEIIDFLIYYNRQRIGFIIKYDHSLFYNKYLSSQNIYHKVFCLMYDYLDFYLNDNLFYIYQLYNLFDNNLIYFILYHFYHHIKYYCNDQYFIFQIFNLIYKLCLYHCKSFQIYLYFHIYLYLYDSHYNSLFDHIINGLKYYPNDRLF